MNPRKRIKKMPLKEFEGVLRCNWEPVTLMGDALPEWARGIPSATLAYVCGSGGDTLNTSEYRSPSIRSGELIGGIDIYRNAPDGPLQFDKDWYAVVKSEDDPTLLLVDGPVDEAHRWLDEIPKHLRGILEDSQDQGEQ
ncbi:MAG: hypothetical protein IH623_28125 [Verrucomicrobia bacterium]|nr:hypothetical protein [Verrucomicrobiota bacterium]